MKSITIGLIALVVAASGCITIDETEFDRKIKSVDGTQFGPDCFKEGYDTGYRLTCEDSWDGKEYSWVACSDGEMINWPEKVERACTVSKYEGDLP